MAEIDPGVFHAAAQEIADLINSRPSSPTVEEIAGIIWAHWHQSPIMEAKAPSRKLFWMHRGKRNEQR